MLPRPRFKVELGRVSGSARLEDFTMGLSFQHILILAVVVLLLFGRNKISDLMGDFAKGIKSFKKGLADDDVVAEKPEPPLKTIENSTTAPTATRSDVGSRAI
jgi:sec-independent protein translocase protein TatA